jgi:hypothetical protein
MDNGNEDLQQYESILALEQKRWIPSEWNEPEEASFTQQPPLQDVTGDSSGSEDGSCGDEDTRYRTANN